MNSMNRTDSGIAGTLTRAGLCLLLAGNLTACAVSGGSPEAGQEDAEYPVVSSAPAAAPTAVAQPTQSLSQQMLFDVLLAEIAGQRGRLDVAVPHYLQAALESQDPQVAERAIQIASFAKDYPAALRVGRHWIEFEPDNLDVRKIVAALAMQTGDAEEVVKQLDYVIAHSQSRQQGFAIATAVLSRHSDRQQALQIMETLASRYPDSVHARIAMARIALINNQLELAMHAVDKALVLEPGMPRAEIIKAQILIRQNKKPDALEGLKQAVERRPDHAELHFAYGRMLLDAGDLEGAKQQFRKVVKLAPENTDALYSLALLELETGELKTAGKHLLQMLETGEKQQSVYYYLGYAAQQLGKDDDAIKWFGRVTSGEYWTQSQLRMAKIMVHQGRLEEVRQHMHSLRRNHPENAVEIYLIEGQILSDLTLNEEAWQLYDQALAVYPDDEELLYGRALAAEKIDRIDLAEKDMRRILALNPDNVRTLNALGYTLADRTDRYEEAFKYIKQAYAKKPDDPAIIDSMGWIHYRLGNMDEARGYLQQAWEMTRDGEIGAHLGEVLWMQGDQDGARRIWAESQEVSPDNPVLKDAIDRLMP